MKGRFVGILLVVVLLLTMCSAIVTAVGGAPYNVVSKTYSQENIEVDYPQVTDLPDGAIQQRINELLRDKPFKCWETDCREIAGLNMRTKYAIKWRSANLLTVQFLSYRYITGAAHPVNVFATINIDINTGNEVFLKDLVAIDEEFIALLKAGEFKAVSPRVKEIVKFSDEEIIRELNERGAFYLTPVALGVKVTVPHVAGDFVIFEVSYRDIAGKIKVENPVWHEFLP